MRRQAPVVLLLSVAMLVGCGGANTGGSQPPTATLSSIAVSPPNASVAAGLTESFKATGAYSNGNTQDLTSTVVWSSSNPNVAHVVPAAPGLVQGVAPGSSTVIATSGAISGSTPLQVTPAVLTSLAITPGTANVPLGLTQQFTANGTFSDGTTKDVTALASWASSNPGLVTVSGGLVVTGKLLGSCTITASVSGVNAIANLTVGPPQLAAISVLPPAAIVTAGQQKAFTASGTFTDGSIQDITATVSWSSSFPEVATITPQGIAQTLFPGMTTITAALTGISSSASLTSTQPTGAAGVHVRLRANSNPNPGSDNYSDVVADGNFAYVSSWHHTSGVQIFDISNPDAPVVLNAYSGSVNMQGIQVLNGIGYFASDSGTGIDIVDLTNPASPALITQITSAQLGQNNVHDITLDASGQHLYVPGYPQTSQVQIWSVSTPAAPTRLWSLTGSDTVAVHDVTVDSARNRLYMSGWGGTMDIWDITNVDTQMPQRLGSFSSGLHTQDVSVTSDGKYVFCPHELAADGDVAVFDVSNPANVVQVGDLQETQLGLLATSPSTSKIFGNFLFVAWYQAGLAIFDITNPLSPILVGNYDTWTGFKFGGSGGGDGDWGVWPFLGLNKVLVSDRTSGLYVLDATGVSSQPGLLSMTFGPMAAGFPPPTSVTGSNPVETNVFLVGLAANGGTNVSIASGNTALVSSGSVTIPAGGHSATLTLNTNAVSSNAQVTMTASDSIFTTSAVLQVLGAQPSSLSFSPVNPVGGTSVTGTVTLTIPTPATLDVALAVVSGTAGVAMMPSSVTVPAGSSSASWTIQTAVVSTPTSVNISATANGAVQMGSFTVQ